MVRIAFRMRVHHGRQAEYERRHNPICDELRDTLLRHGVCSYSIFLDPETDDLFAYAEVDSQSRWEAIAATEVCRRWWHAMREIMPSHDDDSPVSRTLREVFHLERPAGVSGRSVDRPCDDRVA